MPHGSFAWNELVTPNVERHPCSGDFGCEHVATWHTDALAFLP
jgi:hypothetical protein